jgi:hypothetical protein
MAVGIVAAVILAIGLLPPYGEIWKRRGRVVGFNWVGTRQIPSWQQGGGGWWLTGTKRYFSRWTGPARSFLSWRSVSVAPAHDLAGWRFWLTHDLGQSCPGYIRRLGWRAVHHMVRVPQVPTITGEFLMQAGDVLAASLRSGSSPRISYGLFGRVRSGKLRLLRARRSTTSPLSTRRGASRSSSPSERAQSARKTARGPETPKSCRQSVPKPVVGSDDARLCANGTCHRRGTGGPNP